MPSDMSRPDVRLFIVITRELLSSVIAYGISELRQWNGTCTSRRQIDAIHRVSADRRQERYQHGRLASSLSIGQWRECEFVRGNFICTTNLHLEFRHDYALKNLDQAMIIDPRSSRIDLLPWKLARPFDVYANEYKLKDSPVASDFRVDATSL